MELVKAVAKYIEIEDAYRTLSDYYHHSTYVQSIALREALDRVPAADVVERKTGKWVKISPAGIYECSQCGQNIMTSDIEVYKFCHGCGAKMIGGDE